MMYHFYTLHEMADSKIFSCNISWKKSVMSKFLQVIPGNDQNTSPTNQKTAGSKLERTR